MSALVSCAEDEASSVGSASSSERERVVRWAMYGAASGDDSVSLEDEARISGSVWGSSCAVSAVRRSVPILSAPTSAIRSPVRTVSGSVSRLR